MQQWPGTVLQQLTLKQAPIGPPVATTSLSKHLTTTKSVPSVAPHRALCVCVRENRLYTEQAIKAVFLSQQKRDPPFGAPGPPPPPSCGQPFQICQIAAWIQSCTNMKLRQTNDERAWSFVPPDWCVWGVEDKTRRHLTLGGRAVDRTQPRSDCTWLWPINHVAPSGGRARGCSRCDIHNCREQSDCMPPPLRTSLFHLFLLLCHAWGMITRMHACMFSLLQLIAAG